MPQPLVPPPVSDTGAWTWPRTLQRWLDINPVTKLTRISTFITLPTFSQTNSWNGYSDIVASFNIEAPNNFSLTGVATDVPPSVNYVLCISYRIGTIVTRYMLWSAQGAVMNQNIPLYTGQPILKNCRFEIWNTSQGATSQGTNIKFYTSVLGKQDYRYASDGTLVGVDAENDSFKCNQGSPSTFNSGAGQFNYFWLKTSTVTGFHNTWTDSTGSVTLTSAIPGIFNKFGYARASVLLLSNPQFTYNARPLQHNADIWFSLFCGDTGIDSSVNLLDIGVAYGYLNITLDSKTNVLAVAPASNGPSVILPAHQQWYIIRVTNTAAATTLTVYDYVGNVLVTSSTAQVVADGGSIITVGSTTPVLDSLISDIVIFSDLYDNWYPKMDMINFFATTFFTSNYSLPLTFPSTSVSKSN